MTAGVKLTIVFAICANVNALKLVVLIVSQKVNGGYSSIDEFILSEE